MSKFITSVQLKDAAQGDYEKLDLEMEKKKFIKVVRSQVSEYREYNHRGLTTLQDVITAAYTAASRIGRQYSLTVMKEKRTVA